MTQFYYLLCMYILWKIECLEANDSTPRLANDWSLSQRCYYIYTLHRVVHKLATRGAATIKPEGARCWLAEGSGNHVCRRELEHSSTVDRGSQAAGGLLAKLGLS